MVPRQMFLILVTNSLDLSSSWLIYNGQKDQSMHTPTIGMGNGVGVLSGKARLKKFVNRLILTLHFITQS